MKKSLLGLSAVVSLAFTLPVHAEVNAAQAKELATKSGCFSCHDMTKKVLGPAYLDVAKKYRGEKGEADVLAQKIMNGGKGVWGRVAMPPNNVSREDAKMLAEWILAMK